MGIMEVEVERNIQAVTLALRPPHQREQESLLRAGADYLRDNPHLSLLHIDYASDELGDYLTLYVTDLRKMSEREQEQEKP